MTKWDVFFGIGLLIGFGVLLDGMNIYEHWRVMLKVLGYVLLVLWCICGLVYFFVRNDKEDSVL